MPGITACIPRNTEVWFTLQTRWYSCSVRSTVDASAPIIPALFTSTLMCPKRSCPSLMIASQSALRVTSCFTNKAFGPSSDASFAPPSSFTSPNMTFAPCATKQRACEAPIPWDAPVMTATFPDSLLMDMRRYCLEYDGLGFQIGQQAFNAALPPDA